MWQGFLEYADKSSQVDRKKETFLKHYVYKTIEDSCLSIIPFRHFQVSSVHHKHKLCGRNVVVPRTVTTLRTTHTLSSNEVYLSAERLYDYLYAVTSLLLWVLNIS